SCRRKTRPPCSGPTHRHQPHDPQQLADLNISKQHLLSKVIGKRFAAVPPHPRAGLVEIVNLGRLDAKSRFLGPDGFGYVKNFVRYASKSLEELWQVVENKLDCAIAACHDRSVFDYPEHVRTIKRRHRAASCPLCPHAAVPG
ncbi:hypothetical protein ACPZ19_51200, partial [Amycolatopsis lurida]